MYKFGVVVEKNFDDLTEMVEQIEKGDVLLI